MIAPDSAIWKTNWFVIESKVHQDVEYFLWLISIYILLLLILTLWYLTSNWNYFIFFPMILVIYEIVYLIQEDIYGLEHSENYFFTSFLFSIPYISLLHYLSLKLSYSVTDKKITTQLNTEINAELNNLSTLTHRDYRLIKKQLKTIRAKKETLSKKAYLIELIALRDQLQ